MSAPTSFALIKSYDEARKQRRYEEKFSYDMMDAGVFAAISQVEVDYGSLSSQVNGIIG